MNTRYYLDTEFNSFGGSLISIGITRHDGTDSLYLVVPKADIDDMREAEGMDPWIETNVIANLFSVPDGVSIDIFPVDEWGPIIGAFIYREGEPPPQIMVDWPSDAMDFSKLLMTGPGKAVPMGNQTHITILRHIDVYPTTLEGAVQHNAIWDAMAIRQLLIDLEAKPKPDPIQKLGRPMFHDAATQAAIDRLGNEFHKTRLSHGVMVEPGDLSLALKALGYYG